MLCVYGKALAVSSRRLMAEKLLKNNNFYIYNNDEKIILK